MSKQNWSHQYNLFFNFSVCLIRLNDFEVSVDLIVVAVFIIALKGLQSCIDPIKDNSFFSYQLLYNEFDSLFAEESEQSNLKILENFFQTLDSSMPQNKLKIIITQILFSDFTDNSFKLNNHKHFFLVRRSSTKVKSPTFELKNSVCLRLQELFIVEYLVKLVCTILLRFSILHHCCLLF